MQKLVDLRQQARSPFQRLLAPAAERILALSWLNRVYEDIEKTPPEGFYESTLEKIGLSYTTNEGGLFRIPESGGALIVANHPFGGADAIILADLLTRLRPDTKILANHLLHTIPEIREHIIPVDVFAGKDAPAKNRAPLRKALAHLKAGGLLAIFPAGEVSSYKPGTAKIRDKPWSPHTALLARKAQVPVIPIHFRGINSPFFQVTGLIHPILRTLQLPRELRRMRGKTVPVRIGKPIPPNKFPKTATHQELTDHFRLRTEILAETTRLERKQRTRTGKLLQPTDLATIAPPEAPAALRAEIEALPEEALLTSQDTLQVYLATAQQAPTILQEIGRLREVTFRAVGEGTGLERDLDRFDQHYRHLFLWDTNTQEIAGAYRMALTDELTTEDLYTATLFNFKPGFLEALGPSIELGRSFVTARYQKKLTSLLLLWKGICGYAAYNPRYRRTFGPVSISQDYHALSRSLLVRYLKTHTKDKELGKYVTAPNPPENERLRHLKMGAPGLQSIEDVGGVISEIESDGKGIPVLIKQYLKMSATILSFNVDDDFSGVIDGLIVVDFKKADPKLLSRYMGKEGIKNFQSHWKI